ncbi:MAG: thiamine phosphate synthase [Planctomycetota bacterium]|nr:thiamine phosphate synthase [Planctomycetota bacterium]
MPNILRIIDVNANRAREALRVMEEAARFLLDDADLTAAIKNLRHDLAHALASVAALEANRDTPGDVGTTIKTATELRRESAGEVVLAAGKRLSEALRAIEEYAKTLPAPANGLAAQAEGLRYRGYDLEQRLARAMGSGAARQWRLCVLLSAELCPRGDWLAVARACLDAGADCLQLREKSLDAGELLLRTRNLVALARPRGVSVIVNDRPDVALLAGADGVHLGQTDLPCAEVRKLVGRQLLVGVSTSRIEEAKQALADGADYCGVGPMFATTTKRKDHIVGPDYLREYTRWGRLPHLAIGGIIPERIAELVQAGLRGVAVSSAACAAPDPHVAVRRLLDALPPHSA